MYTEKKLSLIERKKLQWAQEREELAALNAPWGRDTRTRNASKLPNTDELLRRDQHSRRDSLPPLYRNQNDKEMGGETSGYGSDNANNSPEHFRQKSWNQALGYESSSSTREDRPKWSDRGKFWNQKEVDGFEKSSDTPGWVKRGLERNTELIVSNTSPAESPEQDYLERPGTSSMNSQIRCHIRGQNVPVEPIELAEREKRRQLALAHQEAIRQQLEEREKRRKEERERTLREEYEEELRIERENEMERQRKEKEQQLLKEKAERETKRKEALKEAIELAEKQAKHEKLKQKMLKQNDVNINENFVDKDDKPRSIENVNVRKNISCQEDVGQLCKKNNNLINENNKESFEIQNNIKVLNNEELSKDGAINKDVPPLQLPPVNQQENLLVFQTPYETFQNMQFAVLMPANGATAFPIAVPLTVATDRSNTTRTENRILTPTQYRNKALCDSSTQTETSDFIKKDMENVREKLSNVELNYDSRNRKDRRNRDPRETERPKWGVNRPPTRYLKQSEKDPLYQRRKLRQKMRQINAYDKTKNYSSDDSQTASPRTYRKIYEEKRKGRALWRKKDEIFAQNVRIFQTEIVPLETDHDQIYYRDKLHNQYCCRCRDHKYSNHVDILKIEQNSPRHRFKKEIKNTDYINNNCDSNSDAFEPNAHNEKWENLPRTPSPYISRRNLES